jgi:hypothetical protein
MSKVRLIFVGLDLWDGGDEFPEDVEIPRVPVVGELIAGPDDFGLWCVDSVRYIYAGGFGVPPRRVEVRLVPGAWQGREVL